MRPHAIPSAHLEHAAQAKDRAVARHDFPADERRFEVFAARLGDAGAPKRIARERQRNAHIHPGFVSAQRHE